MDSEVSKTTRAAADISIEWKMIWKLVDWHSTGSKDHLPWHRDPAAASSALRDSQAPTEEAKDAPKYIESTLPWLRGTKIDWTPEGRRNAWNISNRLLAYSHYANLFDDLHTVIELMLTEARDATRADGGTFYLVTHDEERLKIAFFQNDTLSHGQTNSRDRYMNVEIPISETSIAGFVAKSKRVLNIPNVAEIPNDVPYSFNRSLDESSGYDTVSMLTVPVIGVGGKVIAVLQLINSLGESGAPKAFDEAEALYAEMLAFQSTPYLTRSFMARRLLEKILKISSMRDPHESIAHVERVGSFAAEIYERWAIAHGVQSEEMTAEKDTLYLAAMLHDVGKLLIPDEIIKKGEELTDEERETMKTHCVLGAKMYEDAESPLEQLAQQIALFHHQMWDGSGYTGDPAIPNRSGSEIPIYARITTVANELDEAIIKLSKDDGWKIEDALAEIERGSGTDFDPEVVAAAKEIPDTLRAIFDSIKNS